MGPRYIALIYKNYKTAEGPVRRYWVNKPLQKLDALWEIKRYKADEEFKAELRKRLHAMTFAHRFWTGDFQ